MTKTHHLGLGKITRLRRAIPTLNPSLRTETRWSAVFLAIVVSIAASHGEAPTLIKFGNLSTENGLPRQSVRSIAQSPEGILWFGLENNGLCRYDGQSFEVYNESAPPGYQLSDDHVEAICPDSNRNIWIGTARGLNQLERNTNRVTWYQHDPEDPNSLPNDRIWDIEIASDGRLWIGTNSGLCHFDPETKRFTPIPPPDGRAPARVRDLLFDRNGDVWVMTTAETYRVDQETLEAKTLPYAANGFEPRESYCGTEDHQGRLWFSTDTGHIVFDPKSNSIRRIPILNEDGSNRRGGGAVAATDPQGRVWFGTFAEGFIIIDPTTEKVRIRDSLAVLKGDKQPISTRSMMVDADGQLWIGTKFHGLVYYHPRLETFAHWPSETFNRDSNANATPLSIAADPIGSLWIGTHYAGIAKLDPKTGVVRNYEIDARDDRAQCLKILPNGKILYGGIQGLGELDPETGANRFALLHSVMSITLGPDEEILLGTESGLFTLDPETFQTAPFADASPQALVKLSQIEARVLYLDPNNFLWIASENDSIYRLDLAQGNLEKLEDLAAEKPPLIQEGRSFLTDADGLLWIATKSSGLVRFDPQTRNLKTFTTQVGLPSKSTFGLLLGPDGAIWISSDQGICRFDPKTESVSYFGTQHGLQSEVFVPDAQTIGPDGHYYFAGHNGINAFWPDEISEEGIGSGLIFTEVLVGNEVRLRDRAEIPPLALQHSENQIMISFSLLDYSNHGRNEYAYRMSGLNDDWVELGTRQTVSFNYLPANSYQLEIRAKPPGAMWSESSPTKSLSLTIAAPFWQTWPFRAAVVSALFLLLLAIYLTLYIRGKLMRRRLERVVSERTRELTEANLQLTTQKSEIEQSRKIISRSHDELEELVGERTRELERAKKHAEESDQLKSAFLANMSHEIRTPMNAIMGFSSMIVTDKFSDDERRDFTKIIYNNCTSLATLIDDILDLSAIEAGQIKIAKRAFNLDGLLDELSDSFALQVSEKDPTRFKLLFTRPPELQSAIVVSDPLRLRQILSNLISNAIKFTQEGHVYVRYEFEKHRPHVRFTIEDTGIGISQKHLDAIWQRFRKIEDDTNTLFRGTGLGLPITKNLIELLGGEISVESEEGKGSRFTFSIPRGSNLRAVDKPTHQDNPQKSRPLDKNASLENLPTVLVAEDEDSNFLYLYHQIPKERARIIRAYNGQEAIDICHREFKNIELIFMDIKMPIIDGKQAASQIKQFAPHIPIVANTAYASPSDRQKIMSRDFDGYMSKPTSLDEIERMLDQFLKLQA
ncbi:Two component regulator three Y motif family [Verrucomicrobiia bacterium DG1235]|nr:Two component regulator three Y motif family [Verrucomicrobiae bacterium DG1235]